LDKKDLNREKAIHRIVIRFSSKNVVSANIDFLAEMVDDLKERFAFDLQQDYEFGSVMDVLAEQGFELESRELSTKLAEFQMKVASNQELLGSIVDIVGKIRKSSPKEEGNALKDLYNSVKKG